jgi:hypothetical protein
MDYSPAVDEAQQRKDNEQLRLLAIFHFIVGGLSLVGVGFLFLHYTFMGNIFSNPDIWKSREGSNPPPEEFFQIFSWIYVVIGIMLLLACVLNVLSGIFLRQRKNRLFSLIVAGIDCLQIPFGTALGVFTILVLTRDSVRRAYTSGW